MFFAAKIATGQRTGALQVISNRFAGLEALELYRLRWGIELFFSHLKKRGLNFEDTHLCAHERIERLCAVLAAAFVLAYRNSLRLENKRPVRIKTHSCGAKSIFRSGLEDIIGVFSRAGSRCLWLLFSLLVATDDLSFSAPCLSHHSTLSKIVM